MADPFAHYADRKNQITLRHDARLISHSEVATFKRCRRKWWLAWYRGLRLSAESQSGVRAVGDRIHQALARWYVPDSSQRVDPRDALEQIIKQQGSTDVAVLKDHDLERAMIEGYVQWLGETGADDDYEILASETYEDALLPGVVGRDGVTVYVIAKLDAKVRRRSDRSVRFIDHKTVADFGSKTLLLAIDEQMLWYDLIEILTNTPNDDRSTGAVYNMLRRVKRTARARPPFYEREEVRHNRHQIESFYHQLWGTIRDLLELERRLDDGAPHQRVAYPNPLGDCSWSCDYRAICPLFNDGSRAEAMISQYYTAGDPLAYYYKDEVKKDDES